MELSARQHLTVAVLNRKHIALGDVICVWPFSRIPVWVLHNAIDKEMKSIGVREMPRPVIRGVVVPDRLHAPNSP